MRKVFMVCAVLFGAMVFSGGVSAAPVGSGVSLPLAQLPVVKAQVIRRCVAVGVTRRGRRIR